MHPLIRAYIDLKLWSDLAILPTSLYYPQWIEGLLDRQDYLVELKRGMGL